MWAHPYSIKLMNSFPIMYICNTTYKANNYRLLLLEIVGITSTSMTFAIAFAYLRYERMDNFQWALRKLKVLFVKDNVLPLVLVNDRNLASMNALEIVFPSSTNLLCLFHITKNVSVKCKILVDKGEE